MKQFRFKKLDAFAAGQSSGNPAGMITVDSFADIAPEEMQQIARELQGFVSEVGFVCRMAPERVALRYFSAEREVAFCGHATIAILYDLFANDPDLRNLPAIHVDTTTSSLIAENRVAPDNAVFISAPNPVSTRQDIAETSIATALGIDPTDISTSLPTAKINAGLETLLVPFTTLQSTLTVLPDQDRLRRFCEDHAIDIVTIFTGETARFDAAWRSRVFAPRFGYLEDPATGSGNAALGHYLLQQGLWDGETLIIEQNGERDDPNIIKLMARSREKGGPQVFIGGGAVSRIEGLYLLRRPGS
ncbi:PhzF family phenazine biosynthesis protein [Desulfoprunum benzoelyticum]|uniref:PhzF family phenazine biosynthesis protein n=1 Tax=Desulfoprunum benzoelyticum TaxID=1506996 RepID=A0A840V0P0_9BACT|nr:PhzF family phenazine biosynthesis protein [Desulfoprunum benzoelyticum]MBB5349244.1 PhzF family phenazine biosynthesis protein [Desulfoprunum benzoelyticum]MBM9530825.1 PhzF family phenazine biosynthesis protein [Desulfoprunum benzoelyticum]